MSDDEEIPMLVETDKVPQLLQERNQERVIDRRGGEEEEDLNRRDTRVPCTLISGFLGAGKSTLLKRILTERHGYRIAVIMNEFGDTADIENKAINISSPSTSSTSTSTTTSTSGVPNEKLELTEEFLELPNGCLCCSIKDTGIAAIEKLMERKGGFDYILLETTGLADPGPIAGNFWVNEEYASGEMEREGRGKGLGGEMYLDGVVVVVDAVFGEKQMDEDEEGEGVSVRQIACADVILLNKTDISLDTESGEGERLGRLERLERRIRDVNPSAPIYRTVKGEVDLGLVIGIEAYSAKLDLGTRTGTGTGIGIGAGPSGEGEHSHNHGGEHGHGDGCGDCEHEHKRGTSHDGVSSIQVTCPPLSASRAQKLDEWIRAALWEGEILGGGAGEGGSGGEKVEVLRCKGVYSMESGERHVLQGVRNLYEITRVEEGGEVVGVPEEGKLVFIGKGVGEEARRSLEKVLRGD